ncbi:hypothetical protein NM688_g3215 [Phlebia brevispora]|uniref:Uncharacterized protein n=1 Tax=Phlebia brevispora TaxID=194682 RepID=A0ACC1T6H0_9APHY|nr:hypothetical protein NM688_g3215 [Phlebia brevispora]
MPAFQSPFAAGKRKHDYDESNLPLSKRPALSHGTAHGESSNSRGHADGYWIVQWRNPQYKKHKTWDGDAVLVVRGEWCELQDVENGQRIGSGKPVGIDSCAKIAVGASFSIGGKECEVDCALNAAEYLTGACFSGGLSVTTGSAATAPALRNSSSASKQFKPLRPKNSIGNFKPPSFVSRQSNVNADTSKAKADTPTIPDKSKTANAFWTVNWRKPQHKKHKTWDGDAFLMHKGEKLMLISAKGLIMGTKKWDGIALHSGYSAFIGGKEVELDGPTVQTEMPTISGNSLEYENEIEYGVTPEAEDEGPFLSEARKTSPGKPAAQLSPASANAPSASKPYVPPSSFYAHKPANPRAAGPLHDPTAAGAIVMTSPDEEYHKRHNKKSEYFQEGDYALTKWKTITLIWTLLKQHIYANIGPVVGKVMIVCPVTLINNWKNEFFKWLGRDRVGVFVGDKDKHTIKQFVNSRIHHVLIIGYERLRTVIEDLRYCIPPIGLIICDEGHRLKSANNKTSKMFEALTTPRRIILSGTPIQNDLSEFHAMADFCNPGLLSDYNNFRKLYETPILKSRAPGCSTKEKELGEARLQQLMDIAKTFVLRRDASILKNYLPPKHEYVVFVTPTQLQRDIFHKILTAEKLDHLVRNSTAESLALIGMLTKISNSPILLKATADKAKQKGAEGDIIKRNVVAEALGLLPDRVQVEDVSLSGKLTALSKLMRCLYKETEEKLVVVSHYTSTLNIIEAYCKKQHYTYHRLDGSTPAAKRQEYVNEFNRSSQKQRFLFLLSSKAGGVGLNLIGASRLCLIDCDWNPSHDLQSMARIHRDGQKRPVFIYRFLTAGSIDEKIYQRQVTKLGLSNSLLGNGGTESKSDSFSRKELRDIFTIHPNTACHTHELLECPCGDSEDMKALHRSDPLQEGENEDDEDESKGFMHASQVRPEHIEKQDKEYLRQKKLQLAALGQWTHINCLRPSVRDDIQDVILRKLVYVPDSAKAKQDTAGKSRLENLLDAVDLDNVLQATAPPLPVEALPGGSVSFLFERTHKTPLEDREELNMSRLHCVEGWAAVKRYVCDLDNERIREQQKVLDAVILHAGLLSIVNAGCLTTVFAVFIADAVDSKSPDGDQSFLLRYDFYMPRLTMGSFTFLFMSLVLSLIASSMALLLKTQLRDLTNHVSFDPHPEKALRVWLMRHPGGTDLAILTSAASCTTGVHVAIAFTLLGICIFAIVIDPVVGVISMAFAAFSVNMRIEALAQCDDALNFRSPYRKPQISTMQIMSRTISLSTVTPKRALAGREDLDDSPPISSSANGSTSGRERIASLADVDILDASRTESEDLIDFALAVIERRAFQQGVPAEALCCPLDLSLLQSEAWYGVADIATCAIDTFLELSGSQVFSWPAWLGDAMMILFGRTAHPLPKRSAVVLAELLKRWTPDFSSTVAQRSAASDYADFTHIIARLSDVFNVSPIDDVLAYLYSLLLYRLPSHDGPLPNQASLWEVLQNFQLPPNILGAILNALLACGNRYLSSEDVSVTQSSTEVFRVIFCVEAPPEVQEKLDGLIVRLLRSKHSVYLGLWPVVADTQEQRGDDAITMSSFSRAFIKATRSDRVEILRAFGSSCRVYPSPPSMSAMRLCNLLCCILKDSGASYSTPVQDADEWKNVWRQLAHALAGHAHDRTRSSQDEGVVFARKCLALIEELEDHSADGKQPREQGSYEENYQQWLARFDPNKSMFPDELIEALSQYGHSQVSHFKRVERLKRANGYYEY